MFKNHHTNTEWNYEVDGIGYLKVGAYGIDDVEYKVQTDGSIYIDGGVDKHFTTLEAAYTTLNAEWAERALNQRS